MRNVSPSSSFPPAAVCPLVISRYFSKDNWNILDTASILFVLVTFVCRMVAYLEDLATAAVNILGNSVIGQASSYSHPTNLAGTVFGHAFLNKV